MAYYNANYLSNPNRLSTRVHYAPGGASSLSLAWDNTPTVWPEKQKPVQQQQNYYKQQTEPVHPVHPGYSAQWQPQQKPRQYQEPHTPNYPPTEEPNRILEAELQYYQNRNRQGQNGGYGLESSENGGYGRQQNSQGGYSVRPQQAYTPYSPYPPQKYGQHHQQLEIAVQQHRPRQQSASSAQYGQYQPTNQQKTSVRVNNPPGGRSNIIFG